MKGDILTGVVAMLIKTGNARLAEKWGEFAVRTIRHHDNSVDWDLRWRNKHGLRTAGITEPPMRLTP